MRVDAVHFTGLDEGGDDGPVLGAGVMAREEGVFSVQGDGPNGAFDCIAIAVDLDASVGQEAAKAVSVFGNIGECFAKR